MKRCEKVNEEGEWMEVNEGVRRVKTCAWRRAGCEHGKLNDILHSSVRVMEHGFIIYAPVARDACSCSNPHL